MPERIPNILTCSLRNVCVSYPGVVAESLNKSLKQEAIMGNAEILIPIVFRYFFLVIDFFPGYHFKVILWQFGLSCQTFFLMNLESLEKAIKSGCSYHFHSNESPSSMIN